jgi:hypothetical protein
VQYLYSIRQDAIQPLAADEACFHATPVGLYLCVAMRGKSCYQVRFFLTNFSRICVRYINLSGQ